MSTKKIVINFCLSMMILFSFSCENLTDENINPNGVPPQKGKSAFLITNVQTAFANKYLDFTLGENGYFSPMMQHTQLDAHSGTANDFNWSYQDWESLYSILGNNKLAYEKATEEDDQFLIGVSLVLRSYIYGFITDLWGPAPYTNALQGDTEGDRFLHPSYDNQELIYKGILDDLKEADEIFSENPNVTDLDAHQDVYYGGNVGKWHKFANSIRLRYYMRLSEKLPQLSKEGISEVYNSGVYLKDETDDATLKYNGSTEEDSWPTNYEFDTHGGSIYRRMKMCSFFVHALENLNDPRLSVWAQPVEIPIKIRNNKYAASDTVVNGVRYIHSDKIDPNDPTSIVDTSSTYVGIPPNIGAEPSWYNLNPTPGQEAYNPHVSYMNEMYKEKSGPLLKVRFLSAAEVDFIFAEADLKWNNAGHDPEFWYDKGIKASMNAWDVGSSYDNYIRQPEVKFDGSLKQIIQQKWIASWTSESEAWFDYRRTGYPDLKTGPHAQRKRIPVRFIYPAEEQLENVDQYNNALDKLEETNFSGPQGKNSAWSKIWLLQGTGKPW